ncbi:MAG: Rrf2 family transcriptional regulator [Acidobacteria bacterium]|nr:Rrf2 family transcriptional regulator [Acidobacteriota bacterium]MBI3279968.1 Rrf2 family transcriptional regulator [Acidobacteriota bacterium]
MLKLSKKADYGLISLKHLTVKNASASAKEIADAYGIPLPLLAKVLQKLARTGFLRSEHGTHGGYRLARNPRMITALEVIRAIDGPIFLTSCFTEHGECGQSGRCIVREPLRKVHEGIKNLLAGISIADMSEEELPYDAADAGCAPKLAQLAPGLAASNL